MHIHQHFSYAKHYSHYLLYLHTRVVRKLFSLRKKDKSLRFHLKINVRPSVCLFVCLSVCIYVSLSNTATLITTVVHYNILFIFGFLSLSLKLFYCFKAFDLLCMNVIIAYISIGWFFYLIFLYVTPIIIFIISFPREQVLYNRNEYTTS